MRTEQINIRHNFTDAEYIALARSQAGALDEKSQLESEAKSVKKDYDSRVEGIEAKIKGLSTKLHSGFENRQINCLLIDEQPEGFRISIRLDNGHITKRRRLDPSERQMTLSTEAPKPFMSAALLIVDDTDWDVERYLVKLHEDEFDALRTLADVQIVGIQQQIEG